ncbi:roquin-1 [Parasteatoda tepidariorum]|uniref:roquin-1 n=1 Tax=Parasteatoda tepidariorum TaxID=114398 RepID=UPI00077F9730|nr:roquin-1 [Parasteatoda tepidariorum]
MPVQAPQWTDFLSCPICYNEFECSVRRPISLGCGHTMCKSCLSKLQRKQCPFDQTVISADINQLPENYALLQLVGGRIPEKPPLVGSLVAIEDYKYYLEAKNCIEDLALYLKSSPPSIVNGVPQSGPLSRPMQRKLVTLINCQLVEEEGRTRAMRATRSIGERSVTELILQHQNPQQLSANLWAAVRARGCQFLGPAMQEEVLKLVLLALEDGSSLSRKVLVMFVVQRLAPHFPQASKTSIGHVVQLLYRASCFKVSKREGDSSLMQLKEEFRTYEALRREHDAQIVQIATEAGLRIAPEQWSSLLYGETARKSHMQSIIDKLQTPQSFSQSVQELIIALQRTGDPGNLSVLRPYLELLANIDPSPDAPPPKWEELKMAQEAAKMVVKGLVDFVQNFGNRKLQEDRLNLNAKYKTSICRYLTQRNNCPRGLNCTFAHSQEELEKYRAKSKRNSGGRSSVPSIRSPNPDSPHLQEASTCNPSSSLSDAASECGISNYVFDSSFNLDNCTIEDSADSSSSIQFCNSDMNDSIISNSNMLQSNHILNPDSPAFQPLSSKSPQVISLQSPYPALPRNNMLPPENVSPLSSPALSVVSNSVSGLPGTKFKLSNKCLPPVINSSSLPSQNTAFALSYPIGHPMNSQSKDFRHSFPYKPFIKSQRLDEQSLAALQERKEQLLAQLDKANIGKELSVKPQENGIIPSPTIEGSYCFVKTMDDGNVVSFYSPWTSTSIFSCGSNTVCNNSDYTIVASSQSQFEGSTVKERTNGLSELNFTNCTLFWPSEKDEFIPFDPPLVSKYGPISKCSKSLIRGPAPIQVNAVSHMGELTSPTSVVRHPLPSASLAPTLNTASSVTYGAPIALISDQYMQTAAINCIDGTVCPLNENDLICIKTADGAAKYFRIDEESTDKNLGSLPVEEVLQYQEHTDSLKEELWEIEKTIEEKERSLNEGAHYLEHPYSKRYDLKTGGTVPTSIGPWPSQTLENIPVKNSENLPLDLRTTFKD